MKTINFTLILILFIGYSFGQGKSEVRTNPVNTDEMLQKFSSLSFYSYSSPNLKDIRLQSYGTDYKKFYEAFGNFGGTAINDTLFTNENMSVISLIALQKLIELNKEYKENQKKLEVEVKSLNEKISRTEGLAIELRMVNEKLQNLERTLNELQQEKIREDNN